MYVPLENPSGPSDCRCQLVLRVRNRESGGNIRASDLVPCLSSIRPIQRLDEVKMKEVYCD